MSFLWAKLKGWLAAIGTALVVVAGVFLYGRSSGRADAKQAQAKAEAKAVKQARGVEDEINKMDGGGIDGRLAEWMRDKR